MSDQNTQAISSNQAEYAVDSLPLVGIVVVHYQKLEDTFKCLASLKGLDYKNSFVILVDSASPNNSGYLLRDKFSKNGVEVIISPENRGFAASNNIGIKRAKSLGAKYFWLLNADTTVEENALTELITRAEQTKNLCSWGSKILYGDSPASSTASSTVSSTVSSNEALSMVSSSKAIEQKRIWSAGGLVDFESQSVHMRGNQELDIGQWDVEDCCDYLPGCSMLVSSEMIDQVGYMREEYFMYFEETDWCARMKNSGFDLRYVPQSVVYHHFDDQKTQSPFNIYYYNRNQGIFWFRNGTGLQKLSLFLRTLFMRLPRVIADFYRAQNPYQKTIFRAHLLSTIDFLGLRHGKRHQF